MSKTHPTKECLCPTCGYKFNLASMACPDGSDVPPTIGDISICLRCADVLEFQPDMSLKMATLTKIMSLTKKESDLIDKAQRSIRNGSFKP